VRPRQQAAARAGRGETPGGCPPPPPPPFVGGGGNGGSTRRIILFVYWASPLLCSGDFIGVFCLSWRRRKSMQVCV
jgi:hypothetical protein